MSTMKAIIATAQGSPEVLQLSQQAKPQPAPGEVLVQVASSAVNPIDSKIRRFNLPMTPKKFPAIIQTDFSGIVEKVGAGVTQFKPGDAVYGFAGGFSSPDGDLPGALAEYLVADARLISHKPKNLDLHTASALPLAAVTAWHALFEKGNINAQSNLLITGGTGGVGHMAVQLAKAAGAKVVTTIRNPQKIALAKQLGADEAFDLSSMTTKEVIDTYTDGRGFDVIFDTVGGETLDAALSLIRPTGKVVTIVAAASHNLTSIYMLGGDLCTVAVLAPIIYGQEREKQGQILQQITNYVETGKLSPLIDPQYFSLEQAADAHRKWEAGEALGKLVIDIAKLD